MKPLTREEIQALMDGPYHGRPVDEQGRVKPGYGRQDPKPQGYAAKPGGGPEGETCGSCRHLVRNEMARTYLKCGLNSANWTGGRKTDVLSRSPACTRWTAPLEKGVPL